MKNSEPIEVLRELKKELNDMFGIEEIAVFGSVARDDNTQNSDIDRYSYFKNESKKWLYNSKSKKIFRRKIK